MSHRSKRLVDDERLYAELALDLNVDLDPLGITLGSHKRLWWRCRAGHTWQSVVSNRAHDGRHYHSRPGYLERDTAKPRDLEKLGYVVIRVREKPLPPIGANDVACRDHDRIKIVADQVLNVLIHVIEYRESIRNRVLKYLDSIGEQDPNSADCEIDRLRQAKKTQGT